MVNVTSLGDTDQPIVPLRFLATAFIVILFVFLGLLSLIGLKGFVTHNYLWFILNNLNKYYKFKMK